MFVSTPPPEKRVLGRREVVDELVVVPVRVEAGRAAQAPRAARCRGSSCTWPTWRERSGRSARSRPGIPLSEYMVSPRWMLKSLPSALIRRKTPPLFQKGVVWPGPALKSVSPVQANSTVAFRFGRGRGHERAQLAPAAALAEAVPVARAGPQAADPALDRVVVRAPRGERVSAAGPGAAAGRGPASSTTAVGRFARPQRIAEVGGHVAGGHPEAEAGAAAVRRRRGRGEQNDRESCEQKTGAGSRRRRHAIRCRRLAPSDEP